MEDVADDVSGFKKGDRVTGMHKMLGPGGTYAERALLEANTTFHVPESMSFEQAVTIPLTATTAASGLFIEGNGLGLPLPSSPASKPLPLVIYGASGSVGTYGIILAKQANIHPLICIAGGGGKSIEHLLDSSKGDTLLDYRKGDAALVEGIKSALKDSELRHALDAAAVGKSSATIAEAMTSGGKIARVLPPEGDVANGVEQIPMGVGVMHGEQRDLATKLYKLFTEGAKAGWLEPRPYQVVKGGLNSVEQALKDLKAGKASAMKYIIKIDETAGLN